MKTIYELIATKRDGYELTPEEIAFLVDGYTDGRIADYQMAAFLMAAFINGLTTSETSALTRVMLCSGTEIRVAGLDRPLIDKHSTGGVGDKLSLTIAPLLANCGIAVGMFSGRGLGHTGGTLDKLESIPGTRVFHSAGEFSRLLGKHHFAIGGQTEKIAPSDRKIYALRDATGTVESIPLIVASIMSKKLALKSDGLLFDVKTGTGAFMKSMAHSARLAKALLEVAQSASLPARALITNMNQPTGRMIGSFLEIKETLDVLRGEGPDDTARLTVDLAAEMLLLAKAAANPADARKTARTALRSGAAYESFCRYIVACGGERKALDHPDALLAKAHKTVVKAPRSGYISSMATDRIGFLANRLGAGRSTVAERIDPLAGIEILAKLGDKVARGDPLAIGYASRKARLVQFQSDLLSCLAFSDRGCKPQPLVLKRM